MADYAVPAGLGEDEEFGVSSLHSLLMEWHDHPPLVEAEQVCGGGGVHSARLRPRRRR